MKIISRLKPFLMLTFLLLSSGCGAIYRSGFVPVPHQPISGLIEIGSEWQEIIPPKPLKPYGTMPYMVIGFNDYRYPYADEKRERLNLKDGRQTRVEAILYDDKGESYELQISGVGGCCFLENT